MARLAAIDGVAEARVDASGFYFHVVLVDGCAETDVQARVLAILGGRAERLDDEAARAQLAARERGDPWFGPGDTLALSYVEARILAARAGAVAARAARLPAADAARVTEVARDVLFALMERVHGEGGRPSTGWLAAEWPAVADEICARSRELLALETADALAASLAGLYVDC